MAFPQTQFPLIAEIAPGADVTADPDNWEFLSLWQDISNDVRVAEGITIEQGRADEANQVDPGKCTFTVNNRNGTYSTRNPLGPYFGSLVKGTPLRLRMLLGADSFTRTVSNGLGTSETGMTYSGSATSEFSVNGSAAVITPVLGGAPVATLTGAAAWDIDIEFTISVNAVATASQMVQFIGFRRVDASNTMLARIDFNTLGDMDVYLQRTIAGVTTTTAANTATGMTYTANQKFKVRVRARGTFIGIRVWAAAGSEPLAWTTSYIEDEFLSDVYSLTSAVMLQPFRPSGLTGATTVQWDDVRVTTTLFEGFITEWPVRWDKSGNDCYTPITASGTLRRLQQGTAPLNSTIYQTLTAESPYAYWPLEDDSGATTGQGIGTGVKPASVFSASFGYDNTQLGGSKSTVSITQDTTVSALVPKPSPFVTTNGWEMDMFFLTEALPPSGQPATFMQIQTTGSFGWWNLVVSNDGTFGVQSVDPDGTVGGLQKTTIGSVTANTWYGVRLETKQSGANVTVTLTSNNLATGQTLVIAFPTVGTVGVPKKWAIYGSSTSYPAGSVGHVAFYNRGTIFLNEPFSQASAGYIGEEASDRIQRLCDQQGTRVSVLGGTSEPLGAQGSDTFMNLLRECEVSDFGILSEDGFGLRYRPRSRRYSLLSIMALVVTSGHLKEPPEPIDDDQGLRNDWTVSRKNGSSARVTDEVSVAASGRYDDSVEINVASDDVLIDHAAWRVFLGTWDELRWPSVTVDLARNTTLIPQVLQIMAQGPAGQGFNVAFPPAQLAPDTVLLYTEGWSMRIDPFSWTVEFNCATREPWRMVAPSSNDARADSDVSFLNASITSTATSMVVARPADTQPWTNTDVPFSVRVSGELMTVTAVSGTGTSQTFTVTRSVNNVVKAQTAGAPVSLFRPQYAAL